MTPKRPYFPQRPHPEDQPEEKDFLALDAIADTVLKYRPKAKSKPAVQRKRRKTILEKKRKVGN